MLRQQIESIKSKYDFIIIDCPPSLGLITLNCLCASNSVIIPIQCEYFALEGLGKLMNTIRKIQTLHNEELCIEGLLLTMYDSRLRLSNNVIEEVKMHFSEIVFDTIIQRNVTLSVATGFGKSIIKYDANCRGAINYLNLARELLNNYQSQVINTFHLAEGPGGFIECVYKYINKYITDDFTNIKIYGSTLISKNSAIPRWKIKKSVQTKYNIILKQENIEWDI